MNKIWTVAKREYLYNIKRPAFLFAALGTPLFFVAIMALSIAITIGTERTVDDLNQVGYVDNAAVLASGVTLEEYPDLFVAYSDVESARNALDNATIDAYFVIAEDYMQQGQIQLFSYDNMPEALNDAFEELLVRSLSAGVDLPVPVERLLEPFEMRVRLNDSGRELGEEALPGLLLFPLVFAIVFVMATQITSGFLMSGLVEEKTNRVIEMLITSISPMQLLTGKILGLALLGLTQLALWVGAGLLVVLVGQDIPFLSGIQLQPDLVFIGLVYFVLGYLLVASIMATIGVVVGSEQESRQYAVFVTLPLFVPYFFLVSFFEAPNGTVATVLSLFPLTAPMAMMMRVGLAGVPLLQLVLSIGLLVVTTVITIWIAVRIFRWGLLLYGKKFSIRDILTVIRTSPEPGVQPGQAGQAVKEITA